MKIKELFESEFNSESECQIFKLKYETAIFEFDTYIDHFGSEGANIMFSKMINVTKDELYNFVLSSAPSYSGMIVARNELEEKIKNSGGLSY